MGRPTQNAAQTGPRDAVREQIYAITTERKLTQPIIATICQAAQRGMFGSESAGGAAGTAPDQSAPE